MEALKRLGHEKLKLNEYESAHAHSWLRYVCRKKTSHVSPERIASEVIHPDDIDITFLGMFSYDDSVALSH